jgi:alcohol dehydrogenase (NADP+)
MGYPDTFEGYAVKDKKHWSDFHRMSYKPKRFEDYDCDIEITHCGICASDLHTINAGWGEPDYPQVVGHEIVGKVLKVGPKVKTIKVGDRVGVGAQIWACLECRIVCVLILPELTK